MDSGQVVIYAIHIEHYSFPSLMWAYPSCDLIGLHLCATNVKRRLGLRRQIQEKKNGE